MACVNSKPKIITGMKTTITVNGKSVLFAPGSTLKVNTGHGPISVLGVMAFNDEFDSKWSNKYGIRADRMADRFAEDGTEINPNYGQIYNLCYFLWKLRILKL